MKNYQFFFVLILIATYFLLYSCKKEDNIEGNIVVMPFDNYEKYEGIEIIAYGYSSDFRYNHSQGGTSINLTEGWIYLDLAFKKHRKIFIGYTVDTRKNGQSLKLWENWEETVEGDYRFTPDSSFIIFGEYNDSCVYHKGVQPIIEDEGVFNKDHLVVIGTFIYQKYSPND